MYSSDDEFPQTGAKKRRVIRACDPCRKKKGSVIVMTGTRRTGADLNYATPRPVRCDGPTVQGDRCTHCIQSKVECTYDQATRKRGPPKGYVEGLEKRVEKLEGLLAKLAPGKDFSQELGERFDKRTWTKSSVNPSNTLPILTSPLSPTLSDAYRPSSSFDLASRVLRKQTAAHERDGSEESDLEPSSDDDCPVHAELGGTIAERLERLELNPSAARFLGKSSGVELVTTALAFKNEFAGVGNGSHGSFLPKRRPEFWQITPWEAQDVLRYQNAMQRTTFTFPDADLIPVLVNHYFHHMALAVPILHRPTFERNVNAQLYLRDSDFAAVFLLVCALGSRYVDDERVMLDGTGTASAGWKYFNQIHLVRKSLWSPPKLTDLQCYGLAAMFLNGSTAAQACWTVAGQGIRYAQDVGVHRKKVFSGKPSAEQESWKRAFWALVCIDRMSSCLLGRSPAIHDEEFDVDLPINCDDEYWDPPNPAEAWKQPSGNPSKMSCFICIIKITQILAFAMRTLYSINKSKAVLGFVGQQWEENIVSELDSALNKFIDSVPGHLRWDPNREDEVFFMQSTVVYSMYYYTQVVVHRPFIPRMGKATSGSIPSLAICTNAARSLARVIDYQQRRERTPQPLHVMFAFTAAVVLLLNLWAGKKAGSTLDYSKEMSEVHKCVNALKRCERYWHAAGRFVDLVSEIACLGDVPLPEGSPPSLKRDHDFVADTPSPAAFYSPDSQGSQDRPIAGSRRAAQARDRSGPPSSPDDAETHSRGSSTSLSSLPVRSEDLGRIPVYSAYAFSQEPEMFLSDNTSGSQWYSPPHDQANGVHAQGFHDPTSPVQQNQQTPLHQNMWGADPMYAQMMDTLFQPKSAQNGYGQHGAPMMQGMPGVGLESLAASPPMQHQTPVQVSDAHGTLDMWSNVPAGFELDDWGSYLTGMSAMSGQQQAQMAFGPGGPMGATSNVF